MRCSGSMKLDSMVSIALTSCLQTSQAHMDWDVNSTELLKEECVLKRLALPRANYSGEIALVGSRHLRFTLAAAPVHFAHTVVTVTKTSSFITPKTDTATMFVCWRTLMRTMIQSHGTRPFQLRHHQNACMQGRTSHLGVHINV